MISKRPKVDRLLGTLIFSAAIISVVGGCSESEHLGAVEAAPETDHYLMEDFASVPKIDVHVHANTKAPAFLEQAIADNFRLFSINVDYPAFPDIADQLDACLLYTSPNIEPVFSEQFDLGVEWYFDEDSVLYGAVFTKDLEGFITDNTTIQTIAGQSFRVTQPINGDSAEVTGIELGVQKFFANGFGVTASYGYTDSEAIVGGVNVGSLVGLADNSYSISAIYEKDRISAQVTLDYTGELVASNFSVLDGPDDDSYETVTEEVSMVTASFRYDITDDIQLSLEGSNLLNEANRTFQRSDMPTSIQVYGRTINFGARYSF